MFSMYDAYVNALTEAQDPNKFNNMRSIDIYDIEVSDVPLLYTCKYDKPFKDLIICDNCGSVLDSNTIEKEEVIVDGFEDDWDYIRGEPVQYGKEYIEEREICPICGFGRDEEFEYGYAFLSDLFEDTDKFDEYITDDVKQAVKDIVEKDMKTESVKLEEDDDDYTKLKEQTKSEMLKYLKKSGLDVDNLIKTGVSLSSIKDAIDKMLSDYTSPVIAEYEQQFNKGLAWDYEIDDNDIIITISNM